MYIRRYYSSKHTYNKTYTDEYFEEMVIKYGIEKTLLIDNANYEIIFEDELERKQYLKEMYDRVIANPRWYLDRLEVLPTMVSHQKIYDKNVNCFTTEGLKVTEIGEKPKAL